MILVFLLSSKCLHFFKKALSQRVLNADNISDIFTMPRLFSGQKMICDRGQRREISPGMVVTGPQTGP